MEKGGKIYTWPIKKEQREIRKLHSIGNAFYLDFNVGEEWPCFEMTQAHEKQSKGKK